MPAALFHGQFWEDPAVEAPAAAVVDPAPGGWWFTPGRRKKPKPPKRPTDDEFEDMVDALLEELFSD